MHTSQERREMREGGAIQGAKAVQQVRLLVVLSRVGRLDCVGDNRPQRINLKKQQCHPQFMLIVHSFILMLMGMSKPSIPFTASASTQKYLAPPCPLP